MLGGCEGNDEPVDLAPRARQTPVHRTMVDFRPTMGRFSTIAGHGAMVALKTSRVGRGLWLIGGLDVTRGAPAPGALPLRASAGGGERPERRARAWVNEPGLGRRARLRPRAEGEAVVLAVRGRGRADDLVPV